MKIISKLKNIFSRDHQLESVIDEAEINIFGIRVKVTRKTNLPIPHEFSVFIPRLELTHRVIEGNNTTENSIILNSLTIVSAPRHEPSGNSDELIKTHQTSNHQKLSEYSPSYANAKSRGLPDSTTTAS